MGLFFRITSLWDQFSLGAPGCKLQSWSHGMYDSTGSDSYVFSPTHAKEISDQPMIYTRNRWDTFKVLLTLAVSDIRAAHLRRIVESKSKC